MDLEMLLLWSTRCWFAGWGKDAKTLPLCRQDNREQKAKATAEPAATTAICMMTAPTCVCACKNWRMGLDNHGVLLPSWGNKPVSLPCSSSQAVGRGDAACDCNRRQTQAHPLQCVVDKDAGMSRTLQFVESKKKNASTTKLLDQPICVPAIVHFRINVQHGYNAQSRVIKRVRRARSMRVSPTTLILSKWYRVFFLPDQPS